jgi:TRAP-type mannitol/chloroaromatic compound transport system permease large subunit
MKIITASRALDQSNKHSQITVSDKLDSLIGPSVLLLVVCHSLAVQISDLWVGLEIS